MLVSALVRSILLYGSVAVAAVGVIVLRVRPKPVPSARIPDATALGGRGHAIRRTVVRWAPWAAILCGAAAAWFVHARSIDVVFVRDDASGAAYASRMVHLGSPPSYPLAPGQKPWDDSIFDPTWVVNESSRPVEIRTVQYGRSLGFAPDPVEIPPGTAATALHIDNLGPDDPPPSSVTDEVNLGFDSRDWLTWRPRAEPEPEL